MRELKQSTAETILVFMTDETDHVSGKTGLTLTITANKAGAGFASITPTVAEQANGWYSLALTTTHTNTLGDLALHITATGADPTDSLSRVIAMDKTVANTPANVTQLGGDTQSLADLKDFADAGYDPGEHKVLLVDTTTTNTDMRGTDNAAVAGDAMTLADGAITDAKIAADAFTAAKFAADVTAEFQAGLATQESLGLVVDGVSEVQASLAEMRGATFDGSTDSLESIRNRGDDAWVTGGAGGGTGARSVTITVDDGTDPLENANVRVRQGAESYIQATNVSGVAVFALDDATWTVTVTKAGYTFSPTTLIVNGTETATYSMTLVTITPSDPGETTGYLTVRSMSGVEVEGIDVTIEVSRWAVGTTGAGLSVRTVTATSDADGLVQFVGLPRLATYRVRVAGGEWTPSAVLADAATTALTAPLGPEG